MSTKERFPWVAAVLVAVLWICSALPSDWRTKPERDPHEAMEYWQTGMFALDVNHLITQTPEEWSLWLVDVLLPIPDYVEAAPKKNASLPVCSSVWNNSMQPITTGTVDVWSVNNGSSAAVNNGSAAYRVNSKNWCFNLTADQMNYDSIALTFQSTDAAALASPTINIFTEPLYPGVNVMQVNGTNQTAHDIGSSLADMKGSGFISATDSLEAIRNRGDNAWITGASAAANNAYTLDSIARTVGDNDGGTIAETYAVNGSSYVTGEVGSGNPGITVDGYADAASSTEGPAELLLWAQYSGNSTHWIIVQAYNYIDSVYEPIGTIANTTDITPYRFALSPQNIDLATNPGRISIRLVHNGVSGINTHALALDKVLVTTITPPTSSLTAQDVRQEMDNNSTKLAAIHANTTQIEAKTDLIPASPAAVGSAMTLAAGAVNSTSIHDNATVQFEKVWDASFAAHNTGFGYLLNTYLPPIDNINTNVLDALDRIGAPSVTLANDIAGIPSATEGAIAAIHGNGSYDATAAGDPAPTVQQIRQEMDTNSTKLGFLDANISSRSTFDHDNDTVTVGHFNATATGEIPQAVWSATGPFIPYNSFGYQMYQISDTLLGAGGISIDVDDILDRIGSPSSGTLVGEISNIPDKISIDHGLGPYNK